jgi:hypothetical protein
MGGMRNTCNILVGMSQGKNIYTPKNKGKEQIGRKVSGKKTRDKETSTSVAMVTN